MITMSASGCLHALGLARPSISPRASLEIYDDSTVRAQDSELPKITIAEPQLKTQATSGYSDFPSPITAAATSSGLQNGRPAAVGGASQSHTTAPMPQARLLVPQFGSTPPPPVSTQGRASTAFPSFGLPQQQLESVSAQSSSPSSSQTLGFSAQQVRALMNRQSRSDMSTSAVLPDQPDRWSVLASQAPSPAAAASASIPATDEIPTNQVSGGKAFDRSGDGLLIDNAVESPEFSENSDETSDVTELPTEPSMLDRLKGFYEPENAARKIWKRPFQKLGNPWTAVFGDRDEIIPEATVPTEAESIPTADVSPAVPKSVSNPLLAQLIAATETELAGWPTKLDGAPVELERHQRRQLDLRLLYLIANQPGKAIRAVEELGGPEQDFWQELMLAMAEYRSESTTDKEERLTNTTGQLRSAVRQLMPLTALQIRRFEICSRIHSFGRLDTFPANNFDPGQPLLLYAEVDNFTSELTPGGSYRTQFEAELKLYEEGNTKAKETIALPDISDESTSERSDYYQSFELSLPSHLKSGQYSIRLRLRDRTSGKTAESTVEFQVRQPESAELAGSL